MGRFSVFLLVVGPMLFCVVGLVLGVFTRVVSLRTTVVTGRHLRGQRDYVRSYVLLDFFLAS